MTTTTDTIAGVLREHATYTAPDDLVGICACRFVGHGIELRDHLAEVIAAAIEPEISRKATLAGAMAADALREDEEARIRADECRKAAEAIRQSDEALPGMTVRDVCRALRARADQHEKERP